MDWEAHWKKAEAAVKRIWPEMPEAGPIACGKCPIDCQSFWVSEDGKRCDYWDREFDEPFDLKALLGLDGGDK